MARHRMPAGTNLPRRKHQTAITQRLIAIPAALPTSRSNSLVSKKKQISNPETTGARVDPILHMRYAARMKVAPVTTIQTTCAGPHGNNAKGAVKIKAVGRYI